MVIITQLPYELFHRIVLLLPPTLPVTLGISGNIYSIFELLNNLSNGFIRYNIRKTKINEIMQYAMRQNGRNNVVGETMSHYFEEPIELT